MYFMNIFFKTIITKISVYILNLHNMQLTYKKNENRLLRHQIFKVILCGPCLSHIARFLSKALILYMSD